MKNNKLDIFEQNAEFFERFNNSLEDTANDRYDRTRFTVTGLENKVEFAVTNAQGRIKKAEQDAIDRINGEEGFNRQDLVNESVGDGKWIRESELNKVPDLAEYRKLDDSQFDNALIIKAKESDSGSCLFLVDSEGVSRGQVTFSDSGLQIIQVLPSNDIQVFTFPHQSGEVALKEHFDELKAEIAVLRGKLNE